MVYSIMIEIAILLFIIVILSRVLLMALNYQAIVETKKDVCPPHKWVVRGDYLVCNICNKKPSEMYEE